MHVFRIPWKKTQNVFLSFFKKWENPMDRLHCFLPASSDNGYDTTYESRQLTKYLSTKLTAAKIVLSDSVTRNMQKVLVCNDST